MTTIKEYDREGNHSVGIYTDGKLFTAMTWSQSKDFKSFKAAEKWLAKYL